MTEEESLAYRTNPSHPEYPEPNRRMTTSEIGALVRDREIATGRRMTEAEMRFIHQPPDHTHAEDRDVFIRVRNQDNPTRGHRHTINYTNPVRVLPTWLERWRAFQEKENPKTLLTTFCIYGAGLSWVYVTFQIMDLFGFK